MFTTERTVVVEVAKCKRATVVDHPQIEEEVREGSHARKSLR
jgi:hypothetical protein